MQGAVTPGIVRPAVGHDLNDTWDLVRKAKAGDNESVNELIARYYERLRCFVRPLLSRKLRSLLDSSDIVQQTFTKAIPNIGRFEMRDDGSFLHWLEEYAKHQVTDAADKAKTVKRTEPAPPLRLDDSHDGLGRVEVAAAGRPPSELAAAAEVLAAITACLTEIPEHYRRIILLRDIEGLAWLDVARIMNKNTESAVRELHRRATQEMKRQLAKRGFGEVGR